jgi:hypothetical protein
VGSVDSVLNLSDMPYIILSVAPCWQEAIGERKDAHYPFEIDQSSMRTRILSVLLGRIHDSDLVM